MITLRKAIETDFPAWWDLRKKALGAHPDAFGSSLQDALATSDDEARRRFVDVSINGGNAIFVAIDDAGNMVGMTGIFHESGPKERHRAGIWGVYVDPIARGQGVGTMLLGAAIAHAREIHGVLQLELTVASHNRAAANVYINAGFVRYGVHPRGLLIDDWAIDEDLMVLILDEPTTTVGETA
ncbi:MAG: GNAT family protein [Thermomicrobiales bacterium]